MSPTSETDDSEKEKTSVRGDKDNEKTAAPAAKAAAKRRTKTGCLTCRKRRIKCGEEKPYCKNCVKSKRDCAGYVQPLVYKTQNQNGYPLSQDVTEVHPSHGLDHFSFNDTIDSALDHGRGQQEYFNPFATYPHGIAPGSHPEAVYSQPFPISNSGYPALTGTHPGMNEPHRRHSMQDSAAHYNPYAPQYAAILQTHELGWRGRHPSYQNSESNLPQYPEISPASNLTSPFDSYTPATPSYFPADAARPHDINPRRYSTHGFVQAPYHAAAVPTLSDPQVTLTSSNDDFEDPDDPWDVEMEDQYGSLATFEQAEQGLNDMLDRNTAYSAGSRRPSIKAQASAALQAAYQPMTISPLRDERNERVFCHFVEVTSRCMTIFERPSINDWSQPSRALWSFTIPSLAMGHPALAHAILALGGLHIAKLRDTSEDPPLKHFTYALRRIGKLLGLPRRRHEVATLATVLLLGFYEVMSADHSRWNLHLEGAKKLIMEHDFAGTSRSIRRMRHQAKQRIHQFEEDHQHPAQAMDLVRIAGIPDGLLDDNDWEVDQNLISSLTGFHVNLDKQFQPNFPREYSNAMLTDKDVNEYRTKMDLRWWYAKQDIFQSMVSGDPLLLDYEWWQYCPPRGRIGVETAAYATFDHLLLLLGRLTNFGGKDRNRKIRTIAMQGDEWRPPPMMTQNRQPPGIQKASHKPGAEQESAAGQTWQQRQTATETNEKHKAAPNANEGRARDRTIPSAPIMGNGAPMYGMMPPPRGPISMHSSFRAMEHSITDTAYALPQLEVKTDIPRMSSEEEMAQALREHASIANAFDIFAEALGAEFEPVKKESMVQSSPFGPIIQYRSPAVACIQLHYNVGKILLHRFHPHMPPAAMIAAGIAAPETREYAQNVGKICAGLYQSTPADAKEPLDPGFAGALIESTFPVLFAAVQYQEASQRGWTISKLHDIARMTGWQTSAAVAAACEIAWEKQGLAGRGPPYARSLDRNNKDARVNGKSRLPDIGSSRVEEMDPVKEHESQFFSHDRNLIGKHGSTRVHWALGLLSVEKDIEKIRLNDT